MRDVSLFELGVTAYHEVFENKKTSVFFLMLKKKSYIQLDLCVMFIY